MMDKADVRRILAHPESRIGSDGCGALFRVCWGTTAASWGCSRWSRQCEDDRTVGADLRPERPWGTAGGGAFADIVLFDPTGVRDRATFDDPTTPAAGIDRVLVNSELAWRDGAGTGTRTGKVLKIRSRLGAPCWAPCEITSG